MGRREFCSEPGQVPWCALFSGAVDWASETSFSAPGGGSLSGRGRASEILAKGTECPRGGKISELASVSQKHLVKILRDSLGGSPHFTDGETEALRTGRRVLQVPIEFLGEPGPAQGIPTMLSCLLGQPRGCCVFCEASPDCPHRLPDRGYCLSQHSSRPLCSPAHLCLAAWVGTAD